MEQASTVTENNAPRKTVKAKTTSGAAAATARDKKNRDAFGAIVSFINDLWDAFGDPKQKSPLALYNRLVVHIKFTDKDSIAKAVAGFTEFLKDYETSILKNTLDDIPRDTKIKYGTSGMVYLDIQNFIYQTRKDSDARETIRQHLLTISAILNPNNEKLDKIAELERRAAESLSGAASTTGGMVGPGGLKLNTGTKEGQFLAKIMGNAQNAMQNVSTDNPMEAMFGIIKSGVLQDMIGGIQEGVSSGEMSMQGLLGSMQSAIGSIAGAGADAGGEAEVATSAVPENVTSEVSDLTLSSDAVSTDADRLL